MHYQQNEMMMNEKSAFDAMRFFLEGYYERTKSDDVGALLGDLRLLSDGCTADPAAWSDWMKCVKKVQNID